MIYLDNASTSFPKPEVVSHAVNDYLNNYAVSPGRGSYQIGKKAENIIDEVRQMIASLLKVNNKNNIAICYNATHALNTVIKGRLTVGDHVLICDYSHNSVLRPIETLYRSKVITYDVFHINPNGEINVTSLESKIKATTKMLIVNFASNVIGVKAPINLIMNICKKYKIECLLDVTQAMIYEDINLIHLDVDYVAGTGHKSLLGPTGCGFLYIKNPNNIKTLMEGGSGGVSSLSPIHPQLAPHKFESGTPNMLSIVGLHASLMYIEKHGREIFSEHSLLLSRYLWENLLSIEEVKLYGTEDFAKKVPVISFTVDRVLINEMAYIYDMQHDICIRHGIQCAPLIHKTLGTAPSGTIRVSPGFFNTKEHIDYFIKATKSIIYEVKHAKTCA